MHCLVAFRACHSSIATAVVICQPNCSYHLAARVIHQSPPPTAVVICHAAFASTIHSQIIIPAPASHAWDCEGSSFGTVRPPVRFHMQPISGCPAIASLNLACASLLTERCHLLSEMRNLRKPNNDIR